MYKYIIFTYSSSPYRYLQKMSVAGDVLHEKVYCGNCAIGLYLDYQKAFDTVDHTLLDKLQCYGIRATAHDWFTSYLSNRLHLVNYNGYESDFRVMKCGVPQGSILRPLLFLIYINGPPTVSMFFMPILFVDDTNLFCTGPNLKNIVYQINK